MNPINGAFSSLASFFSLCAALAEIESEWETIAGAVLARRSAVVSYDSGVLVVVTENRSALHDMNFKKNSIIKAVFDRTSLRISDIKIEIARAVPRLARVRPVKRRLVQGIRLPEAGDPELERIKAEILLENPGLGENIAYAIAGCRLERRAVLSR